MQMAQAHWLPLPRIIRGKLKQISSTTCANNSGEGEPEYGDPQKNVRVELRSRMYTKAPVLRQSFFERSLAEVGAIQVRARSDCAVELRWSASADILPRAIRYGDGFQCRGR